MADIKLYGASQRAFANKILAQANSQLLVLAKQKNKEIENLISDYNKNIGDFWGNLGAWGKDTLGGLVGGVINGVIDFGVGAWNIGAQFLNDVNKDSKQIGQEVIGYDDVAYAFGNMFINAAEGVLSWAGSTAADVFQQSIKLVDLIDPKTGSYLKQMGQVSGLISLSTGKPSGNPIGDLLNYYGPGGQADVMKNWFDAQKANVIEAKETSIFTSPMAQERVQLGAELGKITFTPEEVARNRQIIQNSFDPVFLRDMEKLFNASARRRETIDNFFRDERVDQIIASGSNFGKVAEFTRGVSSSVGRMLPAIALSFLGGSIGAGAGSTASRAVSEAIKLFANTYFAGSVYGQSMEEAMKNGASYDDASTYAFGSAISELMIENASGVVIGESIGVDSFKSLLKTMLSEGAEELVAEFGSAGFSRFSTKDGQISEQYREETSADFFSRLFTSALSGAVSGGIFGTASMIRSTQTLGGTTQLAEATLQQRVEDIGIETFTKESKPRLQRALNKLNSQRFTPQQKQEAINKSPFLKSVLKEVKTDAGVRYELNEKGRRVMEGRLIAQQGDKVIDSATYAVSKTNYLTDYVQSVPRTVLNPATGQIEASSTTNIEIVKNSEVSALPKDVQGDINFVKENFDNVAFVRNTESFQELSVAGKVQTSNGFGAFYDENSGIIYVNINEVKSGGAIFNLLAHEIHDKLDADYKAGRMTPKAAKAFARFQALANNFTTSLESKLNKEGASLFFNEEAYRRLYKNKPEKELQAILARERISGFIESILSQGRQNENILKAVARVKDNRLLGFLTTLGDEVFLKSLTSKFNKMGLGQKYLKAITTTFKNALIQAQENLRIDETLRRGLKVSTDDFSFSLINEEDKELKQAIKDTVEGRMPLITDFLAQNTPESQREMRNIILKDFRNHFDKLILSDKNFYRRVEDYRDLLKKPAEERTFEENQEIETVENKMMEQLDVEFLGQDTELGKQGYLLRVGNFHFHKDEFAILSKGFLGNNLQFVDNFEFDAQRNVFRMNFKYGVMDSLFLGRDYVIYPRWVKPNGQFVKAPLVLNAALNEFALDFLLNNGTLPSQSFSINSASVRVSPTKEFAGLIEDGSNSFYVSIVLNKNVLNNRDTMIGKYDLFTPTRYFDMQNPKTFKLTGVNKSETISVKSKVKILQSTIEMMQKYASAAIHDINKVSAEYMIARIDLFAQNSINPNISPEQLKQQIEDAQTSYAREDIIEVYEKAVVSMRNLVNKVNSPYDIGAIINTFLNPTTRSNADMSYFGLAKGNPGSQEFKDEVNRLLDVRNENLVDFKNVVDFLSVSQYEIDTLAEGKSSIDGNAQDISAIIITQAGQEKFVNKGIYKQLKDFAAQNGISVFEQTFENVYGSPSHISLEQALAPELKKNESDIVFSLNVNEQKQEVAARIIGKTIEEMNSIEDVLDQPNEYWKGIFPVVQGYKEQNIIDYAKQYFAKLAKNTLPDASEKELARSTYLFLKIITPNSVANTNDVLNSAIFNKSYPNQFAFFSTLIDVLSQPQTKADYAQNLDLSLNDHFRDGASLKQYLHNASLLLQEYAKLKKITTIGIDLTERDLIANTISDDFLPDFDTIDMMDVRQPKGVYRDIFDLVNKNTVAFEEMVNASLNFEKEINPKKRKGKLIFFSANKNKDMNFGVFGQGRDARNKLWGYEFGIDYGTYGLAYKSSKFGIPENAAITNFKANVGSIGTYFTYTTMAEFEFGKNTYLDNELVLGDVFKDGKVIEDPILIEAGLGYETAMTLLTNGSVPSQSVSVSFLNAPTYNTDIYSKRKPFKDGYFKIHTLVKKGAMDNKNFLTFSDTFTAVRKFEIEDGVITNFRLGLPENIERPDVVSKVYDVNANAKTINKANLDLAALAMSTSIAHSDLTLKDDWFKEDLGYKFSTFINLRNLEYLMRSYFAAGLNSGSVSTTAEQLKERIRNANSILNKPQYFQTIEAMKNTLDVALETLQGSGFKTNKLEPTIVRTVAKYFSDIYEASRGNNVDIDATINNQFQTPEENEYVRNLYKKLSKEANLDVITIVSFFDSLPLMLNQVNEMKLSKLTLDNVAFHVEHFGDLKNSKEFQEFKKLADEKGVPVILRDVSDELSQAFKNKLEIQKEIADKAFGETEANKFLDMSVVGKVFKDAIDYDLSKESIKDQIKKNVKAEAAAYALDNDIAFSLKDSEAAKKAKRKKFSDLVKKVYGDEAKPKTQKQKLLEQKYADTPEQTSQQLETNTPVTKTNFNTALGNVEIKNSAYNALVSVAKTIRDLIDYQRNKVIGGKEFPNSFKTMYPQYSEVIDNGIKELNSIKAKLETLIGIKKQVSPFDANLKADQINNSLLKPEEITEFLEDQKTIVELDKDEKQAQGILDKQIFFINSLINRANAFAEESVRSVKNDDGMMEYVAKPNLVEPEDVRKKVAFNAYLKLVKLLSQMYNYRKSSAFDVRPNLKTEVTSAIVSLENIIRNLVSTSNLQIENVLDIYDPLVNKSESLIDTKDIKELEKALFDMTSFKAEKDFKIYLAAKEKHDGLLEAIIQVANQSAEEARAEATKGMEKELAEQAKALTLEKQIKQQQVKIQRERLFKQRLSQKEFKALWFRVYEQRVLKMEKYFETLKDTDPDFDSTNTVLRRMKATLSELFTKDWDKASDLTRDVVIKVFNEMRYKDGEPDQIKEFGETSNFVKEAITDKKVKNFEDFIERYGKKLYKLAKKYEAKPDQMAAQVQETTYSGPTYVSLDDIRFAPTKVTAAGTFTFEKPKTLSKRRGKIIEKPGIQVGMKGTKESRYFRTIEQAYRYINNRVNKFVESNKPNEELAKQSSGQKTQEATPQTTQDVTPIPSLTEIAAQPAKVETVTTPIEAPSTKKTWTPKEAVTVQYGEQSTTITPADVQKLIKNNDWNFVSQEQWEQAQIANMQAVEEGLLAQQEEQRIKALEAKQMLPGTPAAPSSPGQPPAPKKGIKNIFKAATTIAKKVAQDTYEKNEKRFSEVFPVIVKRVDGSNRKQDQVLMGVIQKLEKVIRKYRTENNVYNHVSSSAAKAVIENMDKIFRTIAVKGKVTIIPTDAQLANVANAVNEAIYGALQYGDEQIRVKVNESETNPLGYLYTRGQHWFLRDMAKIDTWDATNTQDFNNDKRGSAWRRLMNAIYNFNQKGYGMTELAGALEGFHRATNVEPIVDASLNENEPRTVATIVKQWLRNTKNINETRKAARFNEQMGDLISPLLDPMTVTEMLGLYSKKSWANVMMNKIIRGQERIFEIYRVFDDIFSDDFLKENNKNIIDLETKKVRITNLGNIEVPMSQIIYLRNMMFREIARNKAIDLGLIKGNKTNHFNDGYKVNILAITENRTKKQDAKTVATITNAIALLKELDAVIKADDFAKSYNAKIYSMFNTYYPYINERFKELQGANLTNDGESIRKALGTASQSQTKSLFDVLPEGTKVEDISNLYVPFLLDSSSYFKAQKISYDGVLDMGVFDGMVLELSDSSGRVSVESINGVIESYKREVANYYGLHRIMRDFNLITNYKLEENGQTDYISSNISKFAINYFKNLLMDMAGYGSIDYSSPFLQKWIPIIRQNFYVAALGFNVKVIVTQFATMLNLWNIYGEGKMDFLSKMIQNMASQATGSNREALERMAQNNNFYWDRSKGGTFEIGEATKEGVKARSVIETLKQFSMKGITLTDNLINKGFYLTLLQSINPETGALYTEAEANQTLTMGIIRSQSSKLALSKSALLRSKSDLTRIFLRFMGEPLKLVSQYLASVKQIELISKLKDAQATIRQDQQQKIALAQTQVEQAKARLKVQESLEDMPDFATQSEEVQQVIRGNIEKERANVEAKEEQLRQVETSAKELNESVDEILGQETKAKQLQKRRGAAIASTILYLAAINFMFEMARTKGGEKDKPQDEELFTHVLKKLGTKFFEEIIGMMPFVRDIYGAFKGYDLGNVAEFQAANEFLTSFGAIIAAFTQGNRINWNKTLYNLVGSAARMFGIPFKNMERLITTPLLYINEPSWYQYNNFIGKQDRDNIELAEAIRTNDTAMISAVIERKIAKRNLTISKPVMDEMKRLAGKGYEVTITGIPNEIDEDRIKRELTSAEKEEFADVYKRADLVIQKLANTGNYRRLSDANKARLIQAIYAYYYKFAKQTVLDIDTLSENMTFVSLNEAYTYFLGRANEYAKKQSTEVATA